MKKIFLVALGMTALVTTGTAEARIIPEVRQFVQEEVSKQAASEKLRAREGKQSRRAFARPLEGSFALSTFALRVRGEVGFDVGGIANIKVVPSVEFFWME